MGFMLKEALKTLCGLNQWSYAVFWNFSRHSPKLLIWEECYYRPESYKVRCIVDKMMIDNHVSIVGKGLVGTVAFTGNYQWMLSNNYYRESHSLEVSLQFSTGIQTVTAIPVLPYGVVQFGSFSSIEENSTFVNEVVSLIIQLEHVPGGVGVPVSPQYSTCWELALEPNMTSDSSFIPDSFNHVGISAQTSATESQLAYAGELQNDMAGIVASFQSQYHFSPQEETPTAPVPLRNYPMSNQFIGGAVGVQPVEANGLHNAASSSNTEPVVGIDSLSFRAGAACETVTSECTTLNLPRMEASLSSSVEHLNENSLLAGCTDIMSYGLFDIEQNIIDAALIQPQLGDDLFDVLGTDFKNRIFSSRLRDRQATDGRNNIKSSSPSKWSLDSSEISSIGKTDTGFFSSTGTDHLLDAVVSKIRPSVFRKSDDSVSCSASLTNMSSNTFEQKTSLPYGRLGVSDCSDVAKAGAIASSSSKSAPMKEASKTYSQSSLICDSLIGIKDHGMKQSNSVSTAHSRKPHEANKTNRKRLRPGENPRPRPKDRQMIQDRLKELRELVPNGAKCSIDALLERTIRHLVFLQSVPKHVDKIKRTAEAKIISDEDGSFAKDNFKGGATWAYEIGSQSMVCPIIVKDLDQPRQMLVEMLCEERGSFLEIADAIRGLGLTVLKGLMETRNNKIWACFTVEANRDVSRVEISLSLVRLLEQNPNSHNCHDTMINYNLSYVESEIYIS